MPDSITLTSEQAERLAERAGNDAFSITDGSPFEPDDVLTTYDALTPLVELIREVRTYPDDPVLVGTQHTRQTPARQPKAQDGDHPGQREA